MTTIKRIPVILVNSCFADSHQLNKIDFFEKNDYDLCVLSIKRNGYYEPRRLYDHILIGLIHSSHTRFLCYYKLWVNLNKFYKENSIIYVFGQDFLLVTVLFKLFHSKIKIIYEIPDLRENQFYGGLFGFISNLINKFTVSRTDLIIFTSRNFINFFIKKKYNLPKSYIIENKISFNQSYRSRNHLPKKDKLRIGYLGLLRCKYSLDFLYKLAKENNKVEVHLHGIFLNSLNKKNIYSENLLNNFIYHGPYNSPNDLEYIYSTIDLNWVYYPHSKLKNGNYLYARTNRFYESGFFQTPMIGNINSPDGITIIKNSFGISINLDDRFDFNAKSIFQINKNSILMFISNIKSKDKSFFQITNEYEILHNLIKSLK